MPLQIFPDYRSVRDRFCRGEERGWGPYEGMIVVVALVVARKTLKGVSRQSLQERWALGHPVRWNDSQEDIDDIDKVCFSRGFYESQVSCGERSVHKEAS